MNHLARIWIEYAWSMLWQSSILIAVILLLYLLSSRTRPAFRYALLCLVLIKMALPPSTALITSAVNLIPQAGSRVLNSISIVASTPMDMQIPEPEFSTAIKASPGSVGTSTTPQATTREPVYRSTLLFLVWTACTVLFTLLLILRFVRMRHALKSTRPCMNPQIITQLDGAARDLRIARPVRVVLSDAIQTPFVTGILHPAIVLPGNAVSYLSPEEIGAVLRHELAHIRRFDIAVNILQVVIQILWFFHPGVWIVNNLIRKERERACDDHVIASLNGSQTYVKSILKICRRDSISAEPFCPALIGILERRSDILVRTRRILNMKHVAQPTLGWVHIAAVAGLALILIPMNRVSYAATGLREYQKIARSIRSAPNFNKADSLYKEAVDRCVKEPDTLLSRKAVAVIHGGMADYYHDEFRKIDIRGNDKEEVKRSLAEKSNALQKCLEYHNKVVESGDGTDFRRAHYLSGVAYLDMGEAIRNQKQFGNPSEKAAERVKNLSSLETYFSQARGHFGRGLDSPGKSCSYLDSCEIMFTKAYYLSGHLYEEVGDVFINAPIPRNLTPDEASAYRDVLKSKWAEGYEGAKRKYQESIDALASNPQLKQTRYISLMQSRIDEITRSLAQTRTEEKVEN